MLWLIPADTHRQRIGILANHPLHNIGSPVPATNVSATNVWATPAGIGTALAEIALIPPTSAQGGRHGGADRRCQPFPPSARRLGRVDQVLPHFQRAVRQGARL